MGITSRLVLIYILFGLFFFHLSSFSDFGSNKPHLIFHLGERNPISLNIGWGYWNYQQHGFSKPRMSYENQKKDIYINFQSHNGDDHFEQSINDKKWQVESLIKYQMLQQGWECKFQMKPKSIGQYTWFNYFSIQNSQQELVDHKGYSTPKTLGIDRISDSQVNIQYFNAFSTEKEGKVIKAKSVSGNAIKVYGMSANISETYMMGNIVESFQKILQLTKYEGVERLNDSKIRKWEDEQVKLIEKDQWQMQKFVVIFIYGDFDNQMQLHITNTTQKQFNDQYFQEIKGNLIQTYYKDHKQGHFLRHVLFNLFGGIAYYEGRLITQNSLLAHEHDYCYGFTPSRLIFPRAFLWDDGFHLSVVVGIKPDIVIDMLRGWMNKIDVFGWIGRQQIRGFTMVSLMPDISFVFQDSFEMNPPTLFLPIQYMLIHNPNQQGLSQLLNSNFYKLQKWYRYFKKTQSHFNLVYDQQLNKTANYRWRCKDECKKGNFMGSGLDDYPRTSNSKQISKKHVDIISWLAYFARNLKLISQHLKFASQISNYYEQEFNSLNTTLFNEYLDKSDNLFKDIAVVESGIYVEQFVTHIGYINLFPFILGLLPKHQNQMLNKVISIMLDQKELLSEDGIRSLSLSDEIYGNDDNYWRGPVWININYMILRACKLYYWNLSNVQELYETVRSRVISTVLRNYHEKGYLFQNYHQGKGNRGYPFYGWTSLINNIITEDY